MIIYNNSLIIYLIKDFNLMFLNDLFIKKICFKLI